MHTLLYRKCRETDLSKKLLGRCLRRERNAVDRALESEIPTMMQAPRSTCRKIWVSENSVKCDIVTCMVSLSLMNTLGFQKGGLPHSNCREIQMPYLHWERSLSRIHVSRIIQDSQAVAKEISKNYDRKTLEVHEVSELPCTGFEKMVRYHSVGRPWLLLRQTLDQFHYQNLESTESRDCDQVVEKYSRKRDWSEHEHRVLMVDQLWLWILGDGRQRSKLFMTFQLQLTT